MADWRAGTPEPKASTTVPAATRASGPVPPAVSALRNAWYWFGSIESRIFQPAPDALTTDAVVTAPTPTSGGPRVKHRVAAPTDEMPGPPHGPSAVAVMAAMVVACCWAAAWSW